MQLKSTLSVTSKYAKRLYALGCQWRNVGKRRFEIEELKKMLGLIDKKETNNLKESMILKNMF
jgi:plasmid replication initiation protein